MRMGQVEPLKGDIPLGRGRTETNDRGATGQLSRLLRMSLNKRRFAEKNAREAIGYCGRTVRPARVIICLGTW